jgi:hypothetical protein
MGTDCFFQAGPISIGDCGPSSENIIKNKKITQSITSTVQNTMNSSSTTGITNQTQNVNINNARVGVCCGNITVGQSLQLKTIRKENIDVNFINNIKNSLKTDISAGLDAFMSDKREDIAPASLAKMKNSIENYVENYLSNSTNQNAIRNVATKTIANQTQNVNINCAELTNEATGQVMDPLNPGNCTINQAMVFETFAQDVVKNVFKNIGDNADVTSSVNEVASKMKTESKGLGSIISSLMSGFMIWIIVTGIVLVSLIFLGPKLINAFTGGKGIKSVSAKGIEVGNIRNGRLLYNRINN